MTPRAAGTADDAAAGALAAALAARVAGQVRFDAGSRALYATDASNYRQVPIGVVLPRSVDDVVAALAVCREHGVPVLARGGGTSLAGQCCNVAVILDCSRHVNRIVTLDPAARRAWVEPGLVLDRLRDAAEVHHLTFGPDPATHSRCTLGGMIGNNSCGVHSQMAGKTADNVEELDVVTGDGLRLRVGATGAEELAAIVRAGGRRGEIYGRLAALAERCAPLIRERYPAIPRCVSGYNLPALLPENGFQVARALVGSEGTCVTVLGAGLRLVPSPPHRVLVVLGYPDVYAAADAVPAVLGHEPIGLEGIDDVLVEAIRRGRHYAENVKLLPEGGGWLLVELGGATRAEAEERARGLAAAPGGAAGAVAGGGGRPSCRVFADPREAKAVWRVRESALGATARVSGYPETWEGWEDSAVHPQVLGGYLRELRALFDRYGYGCTLYGHFGHGCVHTRIDFDLRSAPGIRAFRSFLEEAAGLVLRYGGSLSGEHGDGQARGELLGKMFGPELLAAFHEFKAIWDPEGRMNPGKLVDAYRADENLRFGAAYAPPRLRTRFAFAADQGSFARATERCVGVGECRKTDGGTMCPSYMATGEERHSTRGRARLLFEMLQGDPLRGGWRSAEVKEALDLCLACKACKTECPVAVDMASYKAEFLAHHYAGRLRPRSAYAFGLIHWWARLAARAPGLANWVTHAPGLAAVAKAAAGMAPEREAPRFAARTFRRWWRDRGRDGAAALGSARRVVLFPDTFTNHFHPEIGEAAVEVLERLGHEVVVPARVLCCGRPLYDYGMLRLAKRLLRRVVDTLREEVRAGTPVLLLEPSCAAVLRDELLDLLPDDEDARRLSLQTVLLGDLLRHSERQADTAARTATAQVGERAPAQAPAEAAMVATDQSPRVLLHGHCHQKAVLGGTAAEEELLRGLGLEPEVLDAGCCGMAGSFGFEAGEHYEVSLRCGERVLLPAVRAAAGDTQVVAGGFSCREQIRQATGRRALHLAEVVRAALRDGRTP